MKSYSKILSNALGNVVDEEKISIIFLNIGLVGTNIWEIYIFLPLFYFYMLNAPV